MSARSRLKPAIAILLLALVLAVPPSGGQEKEEEKPEEVDETESRKWFEDKRASEPELLSELAEALAGDDKVRALEILQELIGPGRTVPGEKYETLKIKIRLKEDHIQELEERLERYQKIQRASPDSEAMNDGEKRLLTQLAEQRAANEKLKEELLENVEKALILRLRLAERALTEGWFEGLEE